MKVVVSLVAGTLLGATATAILLQPDKRAVRPATGFILGGFAFPATAGEFRIVNQAHGIDSTLYTVTLEACDADTVWDVGWSGYFTGQDQISSPETDSLIVLRMTADAREPFVRDAARGPFTSVRVINQDDAECVRSHLTELAESAQAVFVLATD